MSAGRLEVIVGPMFSGKSEELIRRLRRALIARQAVISFKPSCDDRYHAAHIASHNGTTTEAVPVATVTDIDDLLSLQFPNPHVIGVDEGQFFDAKLIDVLMVQVQAGARVIVAGLDTDFRGEPFDPMPQLMALADEVIKLTAVCVVCGENACHTYRKDKSNTNLVSVGASSDYEARCRPCFSAEA